MYIIVNRVLLFVRDGYNGEQVTVKPGNRPQPVPDWVRESQTFQYAVKDGSVMEVEIKTPLPNTPTASKSTPALPGALAAPRPASVQPDSAEPASMPRELADSPRRHVEPVSAARAATVATLIRELDILRPQMFEDESEYKKLRGEYPDFLVFTIANDRPDLRTKILAIRGSIRHIRLAQELAAARHGRALATIQKDWKNHKPEGFKRPR
jgi:hypothetical protein